MLKPLLISALLSACAFAAPAVATAATFGTNLVTNGDAETGDTTGFTTTGNYQVQAYNQGGFPGVGDPGASEGGAYLFTGGGNDTYSTAAQAIDLSSLSTAIDLGTSTYDLSALIGGFSSQDDYGIVQISFLDSTSAALGTASIGPVLAADRDNLTGLLNESTSGLVPVGTRTVDLLLSATRTAGFYNDGYLDNVSLVLTEGASTVTAVPEAATWLMMIGGIGLAGAALRRANRRSEDAFTTKASTLARA